SVIPQRCEAVGGWQWHNMGSRAGIAMCILCSFVLRGCICLGLVAGQYGPDLVTSMPGLAETPSFWQRSVLGGPSMHQLTFSLLQLCDDGSLYMNPYKSPASVGYSYSTASAQPVSDNQVAERNYQVLLSFFAKFPSFTSNDFYVFGESYMGVYVPMLSSKIAQVSAPVNFKVG
uniref:Carboxypeptidase n=1 Tax=Dromaius novaehollandiae TaxID=8790 RepID=A0A8C4JM70_DRONO